MSKRLFRGINARYPGLLSSYAQGWNCILQDDMLSPIRSKNKTMNYYLIADDNKLEGQ